MSDVEDQKQTRPRDIQFYQTAIDGMIADQRANITRVLTHPKVNFPGADTLAEFVLARNLDEKRKLAVKSELIKPSQSEFIRHVANVRNRYAHNITNISLSISEIAQKLSAQDNGASILRGLSNLDQPPRNALMPAPVRYRSLF